MADESFAQTYRQHAPAIYRYFARRLGLQAAEDLTADTFAAALSAWSRYDHNRGEVLPWLYGIAANVMSNHRRAELRYLQALAEHGVELVDYGHEADVLGRVTANEQSRTVAAILARLPPFDREALLLVAWDNLTYAQVAEALDSTVSHVRSRLHQARTVLGRQLELQRGEK